MKTRLLLLLALACTPLLHAGKTAAGPKGGRLLPATPHAAEFLVTPERRVELTFYDASLQPLAPAQQVVTVIAEPASGRTVLELEKTATAFLSQAPLPTGEPYRIVVQIRPTPGATPQNFHLDLNLATCGECKRAEYACTCEGH
jgi:hypothetical protein